VLNRLAWYLTPQPPEGTQLLIPAEAECGLPTAWSHLFVPDYEYNALRESPLVKFCHVLEAGMLEGGGFRYCGSLAGMERQLPAAGGDPGPS